MPTGFTQPVKDGEVTTFREFAMACSLSRGAAIMQRDDDGAVGVAPREVSTYVTERLLKAQRVLDEIQRRSQEDWVSAHEDAKREAVEYNAKRRAEEQLTRERYKAMQQKVAAWVPPTSEHVGLKKFMNDQLTESMAFDLPTPGTTGFELKVPETVDEFRASQLSTAQRELARAHEGVAEERERVASQRAWVAAFYDSLPAEGSES